MSYPFQVSSRVKSVALMLVLLAAGAYLLLLGALFVLQRRLLFFPQWLPPDYRFQFRQPFEERWVEKDLHTLYFPAPDSKGTIVYFHGNAGSLAGWGEVGAD